MLQATDDSTLAEAAIRGDRAAFGRLLERHYDRVYRIACRYLGSAADAEDIAQEVCLKLVGKLDRFENRSRFSTWLISIAINECRDFLRRRKSSAALVERYGAERALEEADRGDAAERSEWLAGALESLEPSLRETVILVVAEDFTQAEAAVALGCSEGTVAWRMHMAKKRLKGLMGSDDG